MTIINNFQVIIYNINSKAKTVQEKYQYPVEIVEQMIKIQFIQCY